jgi:hemoglobin/transferrin/lactoferrin receptor protein
LDAKVGFVIGLSLKDFGNLVGGRNLGEQPHTGYSEQDWNARLDYFPDEESSLTLMHQGVNQDNAWRTHKTIYGKSWKGTTVGNEKQRVLDQNRLLFLLRYRRACHWQFADELDIGISHQMQKEQRDRIKSDNQRDIQGFEVNTIGAFVRLNSASSLGKLVYGAEFYSDNVNSFKDKYNADGSFNKSEIQGPVADDATYDTLGVYVEDRISLHDKVELTIGGRYDYARADARAVKDPATGEQIAVRSDWGALVGSSRLLCGLDEGDKWKLFGGISQGFRAPNLSDLTRLDSARSNEIETPSPGLDPEKFLSYEAGLKSKHDRWSGQFAYFYTDIRRMIVRTPTGNVIDGEDEVTKKNAGDGYIHGVEVEAEWNFWHDLTIIGSVTWIDGAIDTYPTSDPVLVREPVDRLMPTTGRIALRWDPEDKYWLETTCRMAAKQDELSTRDQGDTQRIPPGGTPGYTVFDLRAGWCVNESLQVSAAIENITHEDYRIHGSGVNEAGRNIVLAAAFAF